GDRSQHEHVQRHEPLRQRRIAHRIPSGRVPPGIIAPVERMAHRPEGPPGRATCQPSGPTGVAYRMLQRVSAPDEDQAPPAADAAARDGTMPATLEQFLAGVAPRAFRFAEFGLRQREDALDAVQDAMEKMLGYR